MQQTALEPAAILTLSAFTQIKRVTATRMLHTILLLTLIRTTPGSGCRWPYPYPTYYLSYLYGSSEKKIDCIWASRDEQIVANRICNSKRSKKIISKKNF